MIIKNNYSMYLAKIDKELFNKGSIKLIIDLKPALTYEKLDSRVLRDFNAEKNKLFRNSFNCRPVSQDIKINIFNNVEPTI